MTSDPVEDVRRYLARDENIAKKEFAASLEGKCSEELMACLALGKKTDYVEICSADANDSTRSVLHCGSEVFEKSKDDVLNTPHALRHACGEDAMSSATSTEKLVEITRVDTSHDGLLSQSPENRAQCNRSEGNSVLWKAVRSGVLVTKEELEKVQQELIMQERLLKALEKDNISLHEERRTLRAKLKEMEQKFVNIEAKHSIIASGQSIKNCTDHPIASSAPLQAQGGEWVYGKSEMNMELEHQKTMVRELQLQLELLQREKNDADIRLAESDCKKVKELELQLRNLRIDMKQKEAQHEEMVKDLTRKIAWYAEHQKFNDSREELIKEQQETINNLRTKLYEAGALEGESKHKRLGNCGRVQQLTKRVAELEEALKNKYPNSIAQLIRSCQPSVQDSKQFKQLQLKISDLEDALAEKDRCAEAAVNRLRVETDRMKAQYQERINRLEEELKLKLLHAQTRRVRELEKQLAEQRQAMRERDRENVLSASDAVNQSTPSGGLHGKGQGQSAESKEMKENKTAAQIEIENNANNTILLLQKENEELRKQLLQLTNDTTKNPIVASHTQETGATAFSSQIFSSMQTQIATITAELEVYKRLLMETQESLRCAHSRWEERLVSERQLYQSQVQQIRQQHSDDIAQLQERHQREIKSIAGEMQTVEEALKASQKLVYRTPEDPQQSRVFLQSVAERLAYLERRRVQKEQETAYEIAEVRRVANFELTLAKQKAEMLLEQKNNQIHEFQLQLDQLLASLALLQTHTCR